MTGQWGEKDGQNHVWEEMEEMYWGSGNWTEVCNNCWKCYSLLSIADHNRMIDRSIWGIEIKSDEERPWQMPVEREEWWRAALWISANLANSEKDLFSLKLPKVEGGEIPFLKGRKPLKCNRVERVVVSDGTSVVKNYCAGKWLCCGNVSVG